MTTHHTIEDQSLAALWAVDPRLAPVVDRPQAEHDVIAAVVEPVDAAVVVMKARRDR